MGDIVIRSADGKELRFTHDDFANKGERSIAGRLKIPFSEIFKTNVGNIQFEVSHTSPKETELEEEKLGGHNAHYGDADGIMGLFASTKEKRNASNDMVLPGGKEVHITHEWGEHGSIEGQVIRKPEQLNAPISVESSKSESKS